MQKELVYIEPPLVDDELTNNKPKNFRVNSPFTRRRHLLIKPTIRKNRFLRRSVNNYKKPQITSDGNDS